jgi:hypothetical protein
MKPEAAPATAPTDSLPRKPSRVACRLREVVPDMSEAQAKMEMTHGIAYAAANHTAWFWRGVYG